MTPKTQHLAAMQLQDAYWYARRAMGEKEAFGDISRSEALKRSISNARDAGMMQVMSFRPKSLADVPEFFKRIEVYARSIGVDARTGEVIGKAEILF